MSPIRIVPRWTSRVATTPRPRSSLASITVPLPGRSGLALRSRISACSSRASSSLLEALARLGRDLDIEHLAAELFDHQPMLEQILADPVRIGARLVHLVDGDDDRHLRLAGVIDGLDRLRHDSVVGGHHQHDDIGHIGAARAHLGEGGVARRIDEGDLLAVGPRHLIGADMLGDAAGLMHRDIGLADRIEQRGLAVVDMAHDGDDRADAAAGSPDRPPGPPGPARCRLR